MLAPLHDASRHDPTGTSSIRLAFQRAIKQRLRMLRTKIRKAVVEYDTLGLQSESHMRYHAPATRQDAFHNWLAANCARQLGGVWPRNFIEQAWSAGEMAAQRDTDSMHLSKATSDQLVMLAQQEITGIAATAVQQLSRIAAGAVTVERKPSKVWREMQLTFDKIMVIRMFAMANTMIVRAFNQAKIFNYREAGIKQLGVTPEMRKLKHDHMLRDEDEDGDEIDPRFQTEYSGLIGVRTAGDDRVCQECEDYADGSPYDVDDVLDVLPLHVNCRCTWYPWEDERYSRDYDPGELRDPHGRWSSGGGGDPTTFVSPNVGPMSFEEASRAPAAVEAFPGRDGRTSRGERQ